MPQIRQCQINGVTSHDTSYTCTSIISVNGWLFELKSCMCNMYVCLYMCRHLNGRVKNPGKFYLGPLKYSVKTPGACFEIGDGDVLFINTKVCKTYEPH